MNREVVYAMTKQQTDRNGDLVGDPVPDQPIYGVVIWPRASEEKDGGEVNVDGQNLKLPDNGVTRSIRADDHMLVRGEVHSVDEPPALYVGKAVMLKTKRVST